MHLYSLWSFSPVCRKGKKKATLHRDDLYVAVDLLLNAFGGIAEKYPVQFGNA